jgi:Tol biopolymer transport system component
VSNHPERDEDPAWHPNGRQLAAVAERDGSFDIYLMDVPD